MSIESKVRDAPARSAIVRQYHPIKGLLMNSFSTGLTTPEGPGSV
jgi:hypothetical protein